MDVLEERDYEDEWGTMTERLIRVGKDAKGKDKIIVETTHKECSTKYINERVKPMNEVSARYRKKEERDKKVNEKFEEWKKEKFGRD